DVRPDCAALDEQVARRGLDVWLGAEPTFTRADATDPPWLFAAEGGDKLERARALLGALSRRLPGDATLHRVLGRHFPEEPARRCAWGARWPREPLVPAGVPDLPALGAPPDDSLLIDRDDCWLTVTPDPGVVEVNLAPCPDLVSFLAQTRAVYAAAREA